jgi:hypothetical protein
VTTNSATLDDTALLEEVLNILEQRGILVSRLRVGAIELDIASRVATTPVDVPFAPSDPANRVVPGGRGQVYGTPSLWPSGTAPTFDHRKAG